jgi:cysteine desulfurase/selenocysteine lyase
MREPPVKKVLYWCDTCEIPLIGKRCSCGAEGRGIPLLSPFDVRPALAADRELLHEIIGKRFGEVDIPEIVLLNKAGGIDRNELVIVHGERFGWLSFDPITRQFKFDVAPEALPSILHQVTRGIIDLESSISSTESHRSDGRIGGKRFRVETDEPDGTIIVQYRNGFGTGVLREGYLRVKGINPITPRTPKNPDWAVAVNRNRYHIKNLERNAIRAIKQHAGDRPRVNVSFSGGKDSTAVLTLARKAGIFDAFFIDSGIEFPETVSFVESQGVEIVRGKEDFWNAVEKAGPPAKDRRWCCKLLKLKPLKLYLAGIGPCVTIQGNRWYESWNRAGLNITSQNPANPLQLNMSPIRNWRALEVFLYLWWSGIPYNPLYDQGLERIGCYLCPAMLESEYEFTKVLHPEYAERWNGFLNRWILSRRLPKEFASWGLWRWKELPPKMREICREHEITLDGDVRMQKSRKLHPRKSPSCNLLSSPKWQERLNLRG